MARKKKREEHVNAEAWAIPYADLVTLLFALFTVMYAMSSVNEGKFRVLSDSMIAAFNGAPKSMRPIEAGKKLSGKDSETLSDVAPTAIKGEVQAGSAPGAEVTARDSAVERESAHADVEGALVRMERAVQDSMHALIDAQMLTVRRQNQWLEIEINTDILFASGASDFAPAAEPVLDKLAEVLKPFPNPIRVEGHTDDRPIRTAAFPSNWELSAARAASVVHQFTRQGMDPLRLEIVGFGEFHPRQPNTSAEGRNANRRVAILVLGDVAAGAAIAAGTGDRAPPPAAPGALSADASTAESQALSQRPAALDGTVAIKDRAKPAGSETSARTP